MTDEELITEARNAAANAYAPFSHFRVGAVVVAADGTRYPGANVENSAYGSGICAEGSAIRGGVGWRSQDRHGRGFLRGRYRVRLSVRQLPAADGGVRRRSCGGRHPERPAGSHPRGAHPVPVQAPVTGYSGTPLPAKLGIDEDTRLIVTGAPPGWVKSVLRPPAGIRIGDLRVRIADLILLFCGNRTQLEKGLREAMSRLPADGAIWVAWPKRASGVATDLTEDVVRASVPAGPRRRKGGRTR